ncbi:UPF0489 family protein [Paenibacillus elgii]|uniref:UPF0489 family protein n=1 Tax=Paenibacillus elgii TaxID=189691 RepID=UPI00203D46AA|nr:UPF0489 family protein [Paenibacillus elgii]MCM3273990.1 UPF0489 family protein [Paenibacillus elgii]
MEWKNDIEWKVYTSDKRIHLMRDHNWAFAAWEIAKLEGKVSEKSLVVHVDSHFDDVTDGLLVKGLHDAKTKEEIIAVSRSFDRSLGQVPPSNIMHIDNFIWASVGRCTIEEVIHVSRDKLELNELSELKQPYTDKLPSGCNYRTQLFVNCDSFFEAYNHKRFSEYAGGRTVILDLDIDAFNNSDTMSEPELVPENKVRKYIQELLNLYSWDLITIAISPDYCGGTEEAVYLLNIVLDEFNLRSEDMVRW